MGLKTLAEKAVDYIKSKWLLPERGILAGGALANTIWSIKNGTEPVINDIDIFVYVNHLESFNDYDRDTLFRYVEKDIKYLIDNAIKNEYLEHVLYK